MDLVKKHYKTAVIATVLSAASAYGAYKGIDYWAERQNPTNIILYEEHKIEQLPIGVFHESWKLEKHRYYIPSQEARPKPKIEQKTNEYI